MERTLRSRKAHRQVTRQGGASIVEAVIALPILLVIILGAIQFGLVYEAKATLNHASLQAARLGAVRNASPSALRQGLARGLAPLYSPDSSFTGVARTIARINTELASDARIRILNPTREAFDDFAVEVDGEREIPNDRLHTRSTAPGAQSGLNIQDANLLKVQITYGYELQVPLVNWFIARVLLGVRRNADPFEQQLLRRMRLPIIATSTVRMQSPARLSDAVVSRSDFPNLNRLPADSAPPPEPDDEEPLDDGDTGAGGASDDEDGEDGSGLDEGFFGFGEGVANEGGGSSGSNGEGTGSGGGVNGGNPQTCAASDPSPSPFPGDDSSGDFTPVPSAPGFERTAASGGASVNIGLAALSVGNPIHVVTGNKYQVETDIAPLPGVLGLELRRHYNSAAVGERGVFGAGWRHSYDASLRKRDDGSIAIVQADGRLITFRESTRTRRFDAQRASDGFVSATSQGFQWIWPSGRTLDFDAVGRPTEVRERNGSLRLRYNDADELVAIVDAQHRELRLEYYPNGRVATVRGPGKIGVRYVYDAAGNLVQAVATDGVARRYAYEDERHPHHLTGISVGSIKPKSYGRRNELHRIATWGYDERGRAVFSSHPDDAGKVTLMFGDGFTDVVDAFGRKTRYVTGWREGIAYVSEVRGPGCGRCNQADAHFVYDERFRATAVGTKQTPTFRYRYDELGRLIRIDRVVANEVQWLSRYRYDGDSTRIVRIERPSVNPAAIAVLDLRYDGDSLRSISERGFSPADDGYRSIERTTTFIYDSDGRLMRIDGPRTDVKDWIDLEYDPLGRVAALKAAATQTRIIERDVVGRPVHVTRTGRPDIKLRYDSRGRVTALSEVRARGSRTTTYDYDAAGRIARVTDAFGGIRRYHFDTAGRPDRLTTNDSAVTTVAHYAPDDSIERIAAIARDGTLIRALHYAYDAERRLSEIRDGDGQPLQRFSYLDSDALPDRRIDPLGRETGLTYDDIGNLSSVLAPDGGFTRYERDHVGRLTSIVAPNDAATRYRYDDFGRRVTEISADRGTITHAYDVANNLVRKTDARGSSSRFEYDADNRLVSVERAEGLSKLRYSNGLLVAIDGEREDERYEYDTDAQLIAHTRVVDGRSFMTRYAYDDLGRLLTRDLPSGVRLRYRYGSSDTPQSITRERWLRDEPIVEAAANGKPSTAKLDALGRFHFGNGLETRTRFDARHGNLSRRSIDGLADLEYEHDEAGRLTLLTSGGAQRRFDYDSMARLTRATSAEGTFEYAYDKNGNRIAAKLASANASSPSAATTYVYTPNSNRLEKTSSDAQSHYIYDASGNPVRIGSRRFEYDTNGRVTKFFADERLVAEYRYNFWGERIQKIVYTMPANPVVTTFLYEQQKLLAEVDDDGEVTREYVYVDHHPVAMFDGSRTFWIHTDHLGTPLAASNKNRTIVWRADHDPFGKAFVAEDPDYDEQRLTLNLRFPGQYADAESGLHYNYFREYDPAVGRYITPDPIGDVGGLNLFAYSSANPMQHFDALGLYQQDVHYYMTLFLAITAGIRPEQARNIALAAAFLDENPTTRPVEPGDLADQAWSATRNQERLVRYHFVLSDAMTGRTLEQYRNADVLAPLRDPSPQMQIMSRYYTEEPIYEAGRSRCSSDDVQVQFFGEYLHAFADTFSHRDSENVPYNAVSAGLGIGHGVPDGSEPDYTYDDEDWIVRSNRTFLMELRMRDVMRASQFAVRERAITDHQLDDLFGALRTFNDTREDEQTTVSVRLADSPDVRWINSSKVEGLNSALSALGYAGIDLTSPEFRFDSALAQQRRRRAFDALDRSHYDAAIFDDR